MDYKQLYEKELNDLRYDESYHNALKRLSESDIEECFYTNLKFGTAGLRGKMGVGPNRMHGYTIRKVSYALSQYLKSLDPNPTCAIAYDSRINSQAYSFIAAQTLASNGVKVYRFKDYSATPELSFAIRHLKTTGGVVITASHNPPEYNGYKVYNSTGRQLLDDEANKVTEYFLNIEDVFTIKCSDYNILCDEGKIVEISKEVFEAFDKQVSINKYNNVLDTKLKVVYTPLHGVGRRGVTNALRDMGADVMLVYEQAEPDGNFPTAKEPNPENPKVFELALNIAREHEADLIIATDPDVDRVGCMFLANGEYHFIDGNTMGILMFDYLSKHKGLKYPQAVSTIVSTMLIDKIASYRNVDLHRTLTGFKYIGEKMDEFKSKGMSFMMGFEESYGYLHADHVRDKDAISTAHLIYEMAAYYKKQGMSFLDRLEYIYKTYGYALHDQIVLKLEGKEGLEKISHIMHKFRTEISKLSIDAKLRKITDYQNDKTGLPKSNVLKVEYENDMWFAARPSGTEPKLKIYLEVIDKDAISADRKMKYLTEKLNSFLSNV